MPCFSIDTVSPNTYVLDGLARPTLIAGHIMDSYGPDPGPRNAPSGRGGILLVSLYSWTCITIGVAIARFVVASIHKVEFDFDDGMVLVSSVSGRSPFEDVADTVCHRSFTRLQLLGGSTLLVEGWVSTSRR